MSHSGSQAHLKLIVIIASKDCTLAPLACIHKNMLIEVWTNALADKKFKAKFAIKRNRSSE
jgi:hypothetical protein